VALEWHLLIVLLMVLLMVLLILLMELLILLMVLLIYLWYLIVFLLFGFLEEMLLSWFLLFWVCSHGGWTYCKSLWIKASAKWHVMLCNVNIYIYIYNKLISFVSLLSFGLWRFENRLPTHPFCESHRAPHHITSTTRRGGGFCQFTEQIPAGSHF